MNSTSAFVFFCARQGWKSILRPALSGRRVLCIAPALAALSGFAAAPSLPADTVVSVNGASVSRLRVEATDSRTLVSMSFCLDSLQVPSNRYRAFTPIVSSADGRHSQRLPSLLVTGRRQEIVFQRDGVDALYAGRCIRLRRLNGQPQSYDYSQGVEREPWHRDARITVEADLCGCGDTLSSRRYAVGRLLPPDPYTLFALADPVPPKTKPTMKLHGTAFINFVVDRWEMHPDYMDNAAELRKITDTLDVMVRDRNISVRQVHIHGYASPEGSYEHNRMLAVNRAQSLTAYVRRLYRLPADVFARPEATPENWQGLRDAVVAAPDELLPDKARILALIDDPNMEPDPKEKLIKSQYPESYSYMLHAIYPHLRRSDYEISFDVRQFTTEEACEVYKTRPQQLSVRELYDVAQTMPEGSAERAQALQTAFNFYPDDPNARVLLANLAIRQKDLLKAATLLDGVPQTAEAETARAVLALLKEDYAAANSHLDRAASLGADTAKNRKAIAEMTK